MYERAIPSNEAGVEERGQQLTNYCRQQSVASTGKERGREREKDYWYCSRWYTAYVNVSSKIGPSVHLANFTPQRKVGIGVIQRIYKIHISIFQAFHRGDHMVLWHFYAIQAISHIEVSISP